MFQDSTVVDTLVVLGSAKSWLGSVFVVAIIAFGVYFVTRRSGISPRSGSGTVGGGSSPDSGSDSAES